MKITLNGEAYELPEHCTIQELTQQLGLHGQRFALELNGDIAPRSEHASRVLHEGDRVEIVRAIGGG